MKDLFKKGCKISREEQLMNSPNVDFTEKDVLFYIEYKKVQNVIAVLDQMDQVLFGVQIFPKVGKKWSCSISDAQDAFKKKLIDFTKKSPIAFWI